MIYHIDIINDITYNIGKEVIRVTKKDKLIERIRSNPQNANFEELHQYLVHHGATWREGKGSHRYYTLNGKPLSVPRHKPVKAIYVLQAIYLVERKGE